MDEIVRNRETLQKAGFPFFDLLLRVFAQEGTVIEYVFASNFARPAWGTR